MVAGVARVPGAAGGPAELTRFAGALPPQPVVRGKRGRAKTPSVAALAAPRPAMKSATPQRCCEHPIATGLPRSSELSVQAETVSLATSSAVSLYSCRTFSRSSRDRVSSDRCPRSRVMTSRDLGHVEFGWGKSLDHIRLLLPQASKIQRAGGSLKNVA